MLTQYANVCTHSIHNLRITYIDSMGGTHIWTCAYTNSLTHSLAHVLQRIRYHCIASIFNFLKWTYFDAVFIFSLSVFLSFKVLMKSTSKLNSNQEIGVCNVWKMLTQFPVGIVALALYDVDGWLESSILMQKVAYLAGARGLVTMSKKPY